MYVYLIKCCNYIGYMLKINPVIIKTAFCRKFAPCTNSKKLLTSKKNDFTTTIK